MSSILIVLIIYLSEIHLSTIYHNDIYFVQDPTNPFNDTYTITHISILKGH